MSFVILQASDIVIYNSCKYESSFVFHVFISALTGPSGVEALNATCAIKPASFITRIMVSITMFTMALEILTPIYSYK